MPRVRLLIPLGDFIPYIADILAGYGGTVYLQKEIDGAYGAAKAGSNDRRNLTDRGRAKLKIFYFAGIAVRARIACKGILRRYVSKHHRRHGRTRNARSYRDDRAATRRKKSGRGYLGKFSPEINSKTTKRSVAGLAAALIFTKIIFTRSAAWTVKF